MVAEGGRRIGVHVELVNLARVRLDALVGAMAAEGDKLVAALVHAEGTNLTKKRGG